MILAARDRLVFDRFLRDVGDKRSILPRRRRLGKSMGQFGGIKIDRLTPIAFSRNLPMPIDAKSSGANNDRSRRAMLINEDVNARTLPVDFHEASRDLDINIQ